MFEFLVSTLRTTESTAFSPVFLNWLLNADYSFRHGTAGGNIIGFLNEVTDSFLNPGLQQCSCYPREGGGQS